jgi:hypothetical protein
MGKIDKAVVTKSVDLEELREFIAIGARGESQAEIEKSLAEMTFKQLQYLLSACQCTLNDLAETICRGKGLKYHRQKQEVRTPKSTRGQGGPLSTMSQVEFKGGIGKATKR